MTLKIVAISGSLEKNSANSGLIRACVEANNPQIHIEIANISSFPLFDMDLVIENGFPQEVELLRQKIYSSHAIIFSTPQHNGKVSAALKNAYDWLSFTLDATVPPPVKYLIAGVMCASETGGQKAVEHIQRIFQYAKVKTFPNILQVIKNESNFYENGNVKEEQVVGKVKSFLSELASFINENKKAS